MLGPESASIRAATRPVKAAGRLISVPVRAMTPAPTIGPRAIRSAPALAPSVAGVGRPPAPDVAPGIVAPIRPAPAAHVRAIIIAPRPAGSGPIRRRVTVDSLAPLDLDAHLLTFGVRRIRRGNGPILGSRTPIIRRLGRSHSRQEHHRCHRTP
jgi:hypothetical protein